MANAYADTADLMERLGIDTSDSRQTQLANIVEVASRWVDAETGHRFYAATETRYYTANHRWPQTYRWEFDTLERPGGIPGRVTIDDFLSVTQVATDEDGDGTYERVWTVTTDYWLGPRNAPLKGEPYRYLNRTPATGRYLFPYWEEGISVTGSVGWCALTDCPADIKELTLMVGEVLGTTLTDLSQPGVQTYNITQQLSVSMAPETLPPLGQQILQKYRGISIL